MHDFKSHFWRDFLAYCTRPVCVHLAMACVGCSFSIFSNCLLSLKQQQNLMKIIFSCIHFPIWPYPPRIMGGKKLYFMLVNCMGWQVRYTLGFNKHFTVNGHIYCRWLVLMVKIVDHMIREGNSEKLYFEVEPILQIFQTAAVLEVSVVLRKFIKARLHEWMPLGIFCTKSHESCHFQANF